MGEGDTEHATLLDQFALFVRNPIDKTVRFEFFDKQFDEVGLARSTSAVDVSSTILYARVGHIVLKSVVWAPADFLGFVDPIPPALLFEGAVR